MIVMPAWREIDGDISNGLWKWKYLREQMTPD